MQPLMPAQPQPVRDQIGVILNHADTFHHFRNILALLDPADFEIVIAGDRQALEAIVSQYGYASVWYEDILHQGPRYRYTLSNYYIYFFDLHDESGSLVGKIYLPQLLGQQAIKLSYTLGVDYWSYADWNQIYDIQLCYGPWQAERLRPFSAQIHEVGYPRYDDFFTQSFDKQAWLQHFGLTPDKPVIVWLPTRYQHTLREFGETVASLSQTYQVLLKPHPLTWNEDPELIAWLQALPLQLVAKEIDSLQLYALADYVICDYGGAPFGALYTDRRLLLFNHAPETHFDAAQLHLNEGKAASTRLADLNPTEQALRQSLPSLTTGQQQQLPALLKDQLLWEEQKSVRAQLRKAFFAPYYGNSSARVADILNQLLTTSVHPTGAQP